MRRTGGHKQGLDIQYGRAIEDAPIRQIPDGVWARGVVELPSFDVENLIEVIQGRSIGCLMRGVLSDEYCREVVKRYQTMTEGKYGFKSAETPHIHVGGEVKSFFDYGDTAKYFEGAERSNEIIREIDGPYPTPIDDIFSEVKAACRESGIDFRQLNWNGSKGLEAIWRRWTQLEGSDFAALIHEDSIQVRSQNDDDDPVEFSSLFRNKTGTSSINLYASTSEAGGETTIYRKIPTIAEWSDRFGDYGVHPSVIEGVSNHTVRPEAGDLFVFNSDMLHSVSAVRGSSPRITRNCFVGQLPDPKGDQGDIIFWQ